MAPLVLWEKLKTGPAPLECRWSLKEGADHGYTNCALADAVWVWEGQRDGTYTARKLFDTGKLPVDLRESPDGRPVGVSPEADRAIRTGTGGLY